MLLILFLLAIILRVYPKIHGADATVIHHPKSTIPDSFQWASSSPLLSPKADNREIAAFKDPTIVIYDDTHHVFFSTASSSGYGLAYTNFTDFASADAAPIFYLDQSNIGEGYRAAPQVFFFESQQLWYLIFQNNNAAYSTNPDISNPGAWSEVKTFYSEIPETIKEGVGSTGYWVDMWIICDDADCYLFSSDDNGGLYRSQTSIDQFPNGMSEPVVAMSAAKNDLFEAANVYSLGDGTYLLLVECIGKDENVPGGRRYFRSWTASSLVGPWNALAATEDNPFMGEANVAFVDGQWTKSISHGEMIRSAVNQTMTIDPCGEWRYLYQGIDPNADGEYNTLPWKLALLTQDGSC